MTYIIGEIVKDFVEGLGWMVAGMGVLIVWLLGRRGGGKEVRKEYYEYYD